MITLTCQTLDDINIYEFTYFEYEFNNKEKIKKFKRLSSVLAYMISHRPQTKAAMVDNHLLKLKEYREAHKTFNASKLSD